MTLWRSRGRDQQRHSAPPQFLPTLAQRANRRRLHVFLGTLAVALVVSLGFTFLRSAEYRTSARIEITPGSGTLPSASVASSTSNSAKPFLTEVQVLTSRPVLELAATRLERLGYQLSVFGPDPIAGIQSLLEATPIPDTNVVELVAKGQAPELLAPLLNAIIDIYQERLAEAYRSSSTEAMAQASEEVTKLQTRVVAKRREVEAFRLRHNIVSVERGENEVLARVRNLSTSVSAANERVAAAEGKLRALSESAAAGRAVVRARDDPTLANLEQRASQMREELRDLERSYTQDYLAMDPRVVTMRVRLAELERQVKVQREVSQEAALVEARQEVASTQEAARHLQSQIAAGRNEVGQFTARFNEYKSQQDALAELEKAYVDAVQRGAKLEASERARMPTTKVLEAATRPQQPWRPLYWRDAALSVGGSLVLALLAMWLVELFNRSEPQPLVVVAQPLAGGIPFQPLPQVLSPQATPGLTLEAGAPVLLPQQPTFPRELRHQEVSALLRAGDDDSRLVILLLLSGASPDELMSLRWSDVDLARRVVRVGGESMRDLALGEVLHGLLAVRPPAPGTDLVVGRQGPPVTLDSIDAQLLCAAHDAGIERAAEITSSCLRHTYIAFLVRQGMRFADLTRVVGHLPSDVLAAYSALSPGPRLHRKAIDSLFPAVRGRESW